MEYIGLVLLIWMILVVLELRDPDTSALFRPRLRENQVTRNVIAVLIVIFALPVIIIWKIVAKIILKIGRN